LDAQRKVISPRAVEAEEAEVRRRRACPHSRDLSRRRLGANPQGARRRRAEAHPFSGLIKLADGTSPDAVKDGDVLFIMARERLPDGQPGRLVAVQRHGKVQYPFRYEISQKDLMMPGMPFAGPFLVQARLDRDGDPMTKGADDLYAEAQGAVQVGQEGVHLVLGPQPAQK
jgi:hypothetical protein